LNDLWGQNATFFFQAFLTKSLMVLSKNGICNHWGRAYVWIWTDLD
jgi:hypothetical protein